jgi:hypothetical protein
MCWWKPSLLTITSLVYIVPFFIGIWRDYPTPMIMGMGMSITTSQVYHGFYESKTIRDIARPIDMIVCHNVVLMHIYYALTYCKAWMSFNFAMMYSSILYAAATYWLLDLSQSDTWHAILHIVSGIGSTMFFLEQSCGK